MKSRRFVQVLCCMMAFMLILSGQVRVAAETMEVEVTLAETMEDIELVPNTTTHVKVPVKLATSAYTMTDVKTTVKVTPANDQGSSSSVFKVKNITMSRSNKNDVQNALAFYDVTYIEFDIITKETAKIGQYNIDLSFSSVTSDFSANDLSLPCYIDQEFSEASLSVTSFTYEESAAIIGNSLDMYLTIKNEGEVSALSSYVTIEYPTNDSGNEIKAEYTTAKIKLGDLAAGDSTRITLPIKILSTATQGTKILTATFTYKDAEGNSQSNDTKLYMDVISNEAAPSLSFTKTSFSGSLVAGENFSVLATIKNTGDSKAKNVKVSVTDGIAADSIMPNYSTSSISVGTIKKGASEQVSIPLKISGDATKGTKAVTVQVSYEDAAGVTYTEKTVVYPVVEVNEEKEESEGTPNIIIKNVVQSPSQPAAGEQVTLSFELVNKGAVDVKDLKIGATGLTTDTFRPVSSDPYIYFDDLDAGQKKQISMSFVVSENIAEGYNTIPLEYSYKYGDSNTEETKTATLNVINIVNETSDLSKSVPKLIISNYTTDVEDLRAGQTFIFSYDIQNTHTSVAAKNIKVTITQEENIFTVTSGSNSSYIDVIQPGETETCSIELKVKADATTKAYPLKITMAYEYDGATESPVTGVVGEEVTETINLQAVENSRPAVDNIYLDSWSTPMVGQSSTLTFQFYNMGKSTLSNVYVTVSGDFQKTDGDKQIIGNVDSGEVEYVEMDVTPLVGGDATGTITITFEDSNGEELTMSEEFTSYIMEDSSMDMSYEEEYIDAFYPTETAKEPILPLWAFVAIQVGIFVVVTPITRKVVISRYKKKMENAEDEM